jgi:hypothetical protein
MASRHSCREGSVGISDRRMLVDEEAFKAMSLVSLNHVVLTSPRHVWCHVAHRMQQHLNSPAQALNQHINSPAHTQYTSAMIATGPLAASSLSTSTSTPQLMPCCTSVMSATGGSADLKLSSSTTSPQHLNSLVHVFECDESDRLFGSQQSLEQHLNPPPPQFQNAIIPLEVGSL